MTPSYLIDALKRDLSHAARSLAKARGFTFVCIISLGIGMGVFVALVTFTRSVMAPARGINTNQLTEVLVLPQGPLRAKAGVWALESWTYPDFQALRDADTGMSITGWASESSEFGAPTPDGKAPPRVTTMYVSSNYFTTFGVSLARGTGFESSMDDSPSAEPRAVVTDEFWKRRLASDPDVLGKSILLDGVPHVVVGVTPEDFRGQFHFFNEQNPLVFLPLERHPRVRANPGLRNDRTAAWVHIHGRLRDGVDFTRANGLVSATMSGLAERFPSTNQFKSATVESYASMGAANYPESRRVSSIMLSLAGTVLLIVCLNISGMMMVRAANRGRELSIRSALGAGRSALIRHLFFEAALIAFVSGGLSAFVLFSIPVGIAWYLGFPVPQEIDFDATGAVVSTGLCLLVSVILGLLPALRFSRPSLIHAMKDDAGGGGRQTIRVHRIASLVQVGIAVPFLVVSGVMLDRVRTAELGFETDGLAAAHLPSQVGPKREAGFDIRRVRDDLKQASGVQSVAIADGMPVDFNERHFRVATGDAKFATAQVTRVGENYLETIGARLLRGRTITLEDRLMASPVAVVSEPLATQLFPGAEAIGQHVTITLEENHEQQFTIVGVTADFATDQLTTDRPQLLLPMPEALTPTVFLIARGAPGDEPRLKAALETALRQLGVEALPGVAFAGIVTGQDLMKKSLGDLVSESVAMAFVGGIVLVLAALGIVGVVSFMVTTRTRELAVRMALGATRLRVFRLMLSDVVKLVIPGVVGGLLLGAVLIRTMGNVMGTPLTVGPTPLGVMEPLIYAGASAIAVAVALLAGIPAARRATSIQPMVAIKSE